MENVFTVYGLSFLSIILGFIALLKQKTYIDPKTNQPTEIEIPIFGKLKTNFPALIFVFLGFLLAYIAFNKSYHRTAQWEITGKLIASDQSNLDWDLTNVRLFPASKAMVDSDGNFSIDAQIEEGKTFEDFYERVEFSNRKFTARLFPGKEFKKHNEDPASSLLDQATPTTRDYKPIKVTVWNKSKSEDGQ